MGRLVTVGIVLFVLAVACLIVAAGSDLAALLTALKSAPFLEKLAWAVVILVPVVLLPCAVWLNDSLTRQQKAAAALELRLGGVRQGVAELSATQAEADTAVRRLARSDPENAMAMLQNRLGHAEAVAEVQESRNEIGDLQLRVDALRARQQALKERLTPVLEKRRSIERLLIELDTARNDLDRALGEIASGDDEVALDQRLTNFMEFVKQGNDRCDNIESASKTLASLKEDYAGLHDRLTPFAATIDGMTPRVKELSETRERLAAEINALERTPQGPLGERVQGLLDDKAQLEDGVAQLNTNFAKLAALRKDLETLFARFQGVMDILSIDGEGNADINSRVRVITGFIEKSEDRLDDIEDTTTMFEELRGKLTELQSRLTPLEAADSGVLSLLRQVQTIRDRLAAQIGRLEAGDHGAHGDLAARVKTFTEAQRELEARTAVVTEHFSKLAMVRKDLAGLFEKLNSAASSN